MKDFLVRLKFHVEPIKNVGAHYSIKIITFAVIFCFFLTGCSAERHISPSISESPRIGLHLKQPILCAVFDGSASQESKDAVSALQDDLRRIYGSSIEWGDYFMKTPPSRVAVRIRIVTLGANFGSRLVSSVAFANALSSAQINAAAPWGTVVGTVSTQQSLLAGSFSGEGWWNGAAWIDVEIQDFRGDRPISFTLPIVSEHRESNMWGYASGDKAAHAAWKNASVQLTRAMDSILRTIRDQE